MEHRTTNIPCAFTQAAEGFDKPDRSQCHQEAVARYVTQHGMSNDSAVKHLVSLFINLLAHNAAVVTCVLQLHSCEDVESLESQNSILCKKKKA